MAHLQQSGQDNNVNYDGYWQLYDQSRLNNLSDLEMLRELALEEKIEFVLDIGCGGGYSGLVLPKTCKILGVDRCVPLLDKAKERLGQRFVGLPIDLREFRARKSQFDLVVVANSLLHIPEPDHTEYFKRFLDLARPQGFFYFVAPPNPIDGKTAQWFGQQATWWALDGNVYKNIMESKGFSVETRDVNSGIRGEFVLGRVYIARKIRGTL